jgi:serine carboxypeptidase-like clade 1
MRPLFAILLALAAFVTSVKGSQADRITALPGFNGPLGKQYSGYIVVNETAGRALHYWFVESQRDPKRDPVVLWMNGGPGCSSMDGYFYEHGPLMFSEQSSSITLVPRPYSWNNITNVLYVEAPAGVGFSYSNTTTDYTTTDTRTALDNYAFLQGFFAKFPEFRNNDFYVSGESYAGVYVPSLAQNIVLANHQGKPRINLKGILVGNGVTDPVADSDMIALFPFLYGHGIFSTLTWQQIQLYCNDTNNIHCQNALADVFNQMQDINIYDIYAQCYHQRPLLKQSAAWKLLSRFSYDKKRTTTVNVPCIDTDKATAYLNSPSVQKAIHVRSIPWSICTDKINYIPDIPTMLPYYQFLLQNNIRVLVYSGDCDAAVPYTGTEYWTSHLGGVEVKEKWRQWRYDSNQQVGGYVTTYSPGPLFFATVKGAGHMVPQTMPQSAYELFERFIFQKPI